MTNHKDVLTTCANLIGERGKEYGEAAENFKRIADIASLILSKPVTEYDVAMIMVAVKLGRLHASRANLDSYTDAINYLAFGAQFSGASNAVADPIDAMAADIAKMYAPKRAQEATD
jgi:hypothetical protein